MTPTNIITSEYSSWHKIVRRDVKKHVMSPKSSTKTRYVAKKSVMQSQICNDVKKFAMTPTKFGMMSQTRYNVKSSSLRQKATFNQKFVMTSKSSS